MARLRRSLSDFAPRVSVACADQGALAWRRQAEEAVAEGRAAIQSGDATMLLTSSRALHFVAGMVAGNCQLREEILNDPELKRFYPQVYLTQDKIGEAHRRLSRGGRLNALAGCARKRRAR